MMSIATAQCASTQPATWRITSNTPLMASRKILKWV